MSPVVALLLFRLQNRVGQGPTLHDVTRRSSATPRSACRPASNWSPSVSTATSSTGSSSRARATRPASTPSSAPMSRPTHRRSCVPARRRRAGRSPYLPPAAHQPLVVISTGAKPLALSAVERGRGEISPGTEYPQRRNRVGQGPTLRDSPRRRHSKRRRPRSLPQRLAIATRLWCYHLYGLREYRL